MCSKVKSSIFSVFSTVAFALCLINTNAYAEIPTIKDIKPVNSICALNEGAVPSTLKVSPAPESQVSEERPTITVGFADTDKVKFESIRLWYNGVEVTGNCLKTPKFFSFTPFTITAEGPITVRAHVPYKNGSSDDCTWTFYLKHPKVIESVSVVGNKEVGTYEDLCVRIVGRPGGKASFDIQDIKTGIPMQEDPNNPGIYTGTYTVQDKDSSLKANIIGHLESNFKTHSLTSEQHPSIFGQLYTVIVTEPADYAEVPQKFKIKGRTRPNSEISIIPNIGFSKEVQGARTRDSQSDPLGAIPAVADENGYFEAEYGFIVKLPNMHAALTITASDEKGNRSVPLVLHVKFK